MKETFKQRIENIVEKIDERQAILKKHIEEYCKAENYIAAAENKIKYDTLGMVKQNLIQAFN